VICDCEHVQEAAEKFFRKGDKEEKTWGDYIFPRKNRKRQYIWTRLKKSN